jgi:hypothetical protein
LARAPASRKGEQLSDGDFADGGTERRLAQLELAFYRG